MWNYPVLLFFLLLLLSSYTATHDHSNDISNLSAATEKTFSIRVNFQVWSHVTPGEINRLSPLISISVRDIYCDHLSDMAHARKSGRRSGCWSLSIRCPVLSIPRRSDRHGQGISQEGWAGWGDRSAVDEGTVSLRFLLNSALQCLTLWPWRVKDAWLHAGWEEVSGGRRVDNRWYFGKSQGWQSCYWVSSQFYAGLQ